MTRRIELGQLFGIPILLDTSWFIMLAVVTWTLATGYFPAQMPGRSAATYWLMGLVAAVLLFLCVLLHELGHSLVAKGYGIPVKRVTLFVFGGVAQIASDPKRPLVELMVALAGPLVSAVIATGCFWASSHVVVETHAQLVGRSIVHYLAVVNVAILVFNLLPGFPLDGGRVLRAALWAWWGDLRKATRIASLFGSGLGMGLLALGLVSVIQGHLISGLWDVLLGTFLRNAAKVSYDEVVMRGST